MGINPEETPVLIFSSQTPPQMEWCSVWGWVRGDMMQAAICSVSHNEDEYEKFLDIIRSRFSSVLLSEGNNLFTTESMGVDLFNLFLANLQQDVRQHYTCNACRSFVNKFGWLVSINSDGVTIPVMWDSRNTPSLYQGSVAAVEKIVSAARVNGVFYCKEHLWGKPVTGPWHHMAVFPPIHIIHENTLSTPFQDMSERREDYAVLQRGLYEFSGEVVAQAMRLLETDSLYRSEKCLGVAKWLMDLHTQRSTTKNARLRENMTWKAVASAPAGYCHVRNTMIGTLLDDIVDGLSFDVISRRFKDKMHPFQYQRPQAQPSAGNIAQAEKVIQKLQAEGSLARRFARLEELQTVWKPVTTTKTDSTKSGVFSHLAPKSKEPPVRSVEIPAKTMTWDKFARTVLPGAEKVEYLVRNGVENYAALLTAENMDAPPIMQWDLPDNRNPFSWYVYASGSPPEQWGLMPGTYAEVTGICLQPSMWSGPDYFSHHGKSVFFILKGAKDAHQQLPSKQNLCLFPETLKSEFHGIRATIEAYSGTRAPSGYNEASACGIRMTVGMPFNGVFRVTSGGLSAEYKLDRWD